MGINTIIWWRSFQGLHKPGNCAESKQSVFFVYLKSPKKTEKTKKWSYEKTNDGIMANPILLYKIIC